MAVRRISDLPELKSNYPDAVLSSCLIEVSYSARENVYQSFYESLSEIKDDIVLNIPKASKSQYGIVKIGNNINVNNGIISVSLATSTSAGILKAPPSSAPYLGTDSSGNFISIAAPTVTTVNAKNGDIINVTYPVGSLFITANSGNPYPPGASGTTSDNTLPTTCTGPKYNNDTQTMQWTRIDANRSLWTTNNITAIGSDIAGLLPELNSGLSISTEGNHQHAIAASTSGGTASVEGSGHHADKIVSTGSSTSLGNPTLTSNWTDNEQTGLTNYNSLINNGATKTDICTAAGLTSPTQIITDNNYKYGAFSGSNMLKTYMADYPNTSVTTAIKTIVPTPGRNPAQAYWNAVKFVHFYLKRIHYTIPMARAKMENTGAHSHTIVANPTGVYTGKDNTVRPTSLLVAIWKRTL